MTRRESVRTRVDSAARLRLTRRRFVGGLAAAAAALPGRGVAQQPSKVARLGGLSPLSAPAYAPMLEGLRQGLRELGWTDAGNIVIDYRYADGHVDRFPALTAELLTAKPDVILAASTAGVIAAKGATSDIPIVMVTLGGEDILARGLIGSLARPGGNLTGIIGLGEETGGKRLQLLRELVPKLSRVAVLAVLDDPETGPALKGIEAAAAPLGIRTHVVQIRDVAGIESAFKTAADEHAEALFVTESILLATNRRRIMDLAADHRLPAIYGLREHVYEGGLMFYGAALPDMHRRAAMFVDKILKGARPPDLPVEQPTKFDLIINMRTARALGLEFPPTLLARADEVVE